MKGLLLIASAMASLGALGIGVAYWQFRAMELPPDSARMFIQLEPGDEVVHAYTGTRWLDSQRYFVVKADSSTFEGRIKKLSATPDMVAQVKEGAGKDLWFRTERVPAWWDVDGLPSAVAVDVSSPRHNHTGSLSIFSKERGLIYVLHR